MIAANKNGGKNPPYLIDPIGLAGGKNSYNYVNANPMNRTDASGLDADIIHVIDNSISGWFINHIALKVKGGIYDINPAGGLITDQYGRPGMSIRRDLYSNGMTVPGSQFADWLVNKQNYLDEGKTLHIESVTIKTTQEQDDQIIAFFEFLQGVK